MLNNNIYRKLINSDKNIHINVQEREQTQFLRFSKFKRTHNMMRETSFSFDSITTNILFLTQNLNHVIHISNINYIFAKVKKNQRIQIKLRHVRNEKLNINDKKS